MKGIAMSLAQIMAQLEAWGNGKRREINARNGAGMNQFGVGKVQLRDLAKKLKKNHGLAMQLWDTGNTDAMHTDRGSCWETGRQARAQGLHLVVCAGMNCRRPSQAKINPTQKRR